jgi:hypothetical protein
LRISVVVLLASVLAIAAAAPLAAQCAMCKAALEGSTDGSIGAQFNRAILVMMAGPYLVLGAFGVALFRERLRRAAGTLLGRLGRAGSLRRPR